MNPTKALIKEVLSMSEFNRNPNAMDPKLLSIKQVAEILSVSEKTVRRLRDRGKLPPSKKIGRSIRWRYADIRKFVERL